MDAEMMETIRQNVRYQQIRQNINSEKMSTQLGHSKTWIAQFERGRIITLSEKDLAAITKLLGVKLRDLIKPIPVLIMDVSPEEADFGIKNLDKIRERRKMSDYQFSKFLGISPGRFNQVKNGYAKFGIKSWWKIADVLDMSLATLIGRNAK